MNHSEKGYWLLKSEAACYSIDDLRKDKKSDWTGIRNYQARNFIRDGMSKGDMILFYHSSSDQKGVYGVAKVISNAHLDPTSIDSKDEHFDPKALVKEIDIKKGKTKQGEHLWFSIDISFVKKFAYPISLAEIKRDPALMGMLVASRGSRLSVQPVSETHFRHIVETLASK